MIETMKRVYCTSENMSTVVDECQRAIVSVRVFGNPVLRPRFGDQRLNPPEGCGNPQPDTIVCGFDDSRVLAWKEGTAAEVNEYLEQARKQFETMKVALPGTHTEDSYRCSIGGGPATSCQHSKVVGEKGHALHVILGKTPFGEKMIAVACMSIGAADQMPEVCRIVFRKR